MEDTLLHLRSSMLCLRFPYIPISIVHTAKIEIRQWLKENEVVAYQWKSLNPSDPNSGRSRLNEVVVY